jgi:hypothetical protein
VDWVVWWASSGVPGSRVVTGSAGTGKSALLGRVVSVANPTEREHLVRQGPVGPADPGVGSVPVHAHARGRTADQVAALLDDRLVAPGLLEPDPPGRRNAAQLVGGGA